jgi:hypothetical protein
MLAGDEDKQLVFTLSFINKDTGRGLNEDIICPKGMNRPKDLARFLLDEATKRIKKLITPNNTETLLIK